jgi:hypothetical protein
VGARDRLGLPLASRVRRSFPPGYRPSNFARCCGRDFVSVRAFDTHRVGVHAYTFAEGMALEPPREDGRRCMADEELIEAGLARMTEEEMRASARQRGRVEFGVPLWHDPEHTEAVRRGFAEQGDRGGSREGTEAVGAG